MNISTEKTRAGLLPVDTKLQYKINTKMVEAYLQTKLNFLTQQNGEEEIPINAATFNAGTAFFPIIVALPPVVLKDKGDANSMTTIFDEKINEHTDYMRDDFHRFFSAIQYNNNDIKKMFDYNTKKNLGISTNNALTLKKFQHSKRLTFGKGNDDSVVFAVIDPIAVFHDMLEVNGDARNFKVYVDRVIKIEDSDYDYYVTREIVKSKKNLEKNAKNLFSKMRNKINKR